jgi:ABC-2 type transport system ATP-binding protein
MPEPIARLVAAGKRYGQHQALHPTDLVIAPGEVLAVLGPNGAGKTTALGLLTGRLSPDQGRAELHGGDPRDYRVRRGIGVMLQQCSLPDTLTVAEHIRMHSAYYPDPRPLAETLSLAGLEALAQRRYDRLSGGEQRRVQFALAICGRPGLLFVDEPTVGLDVDARRAFWQVIGQLKADGHAIVLTTHYLEEADALADRIVMLGGGRVLADGSPEAIKARCSGKRIRCRTALAPAQLGQWLEVESVQASQGRIEIRSAQPEALLRRLLAADPGLADLEVLPLGLEEAFLTLTGTATIHRNLSLKEAA